MAVDTLTIQYITMANLGAWDLCHALLGGTPAMRAGKNDWLPQEEKEKNANYNSRVKRSFLHNAYDETIEKYVSRPFSRPALWSIENNSDAQLRMEPIMSDMDGQGMHHQDFAKDYFRMVMRWGVASAYVDYPQIDDPNDTTKETENVLELRPINKVLATPSIIGWATTEKTNGVEELNQIRVKEVHVSDLPDFDQEKFEQIRVVDKDKWTLYRHKKDDKGNETPEWEIVDTGEIIVNGKVPDELQIVTIYTKKNGLLTALPPFLNLAWTNLELWQSASDQKNILRFDRLGILFGKGFTADEVDAGITVSPTSALLTENPDASLERVETNGEPAENGWKDIRDIMERLEIQGMDPMIQRLANVKAAGINANEDKSRSAIESWVDACNIGMRNIIRKNLAWMGFDIPLDDIKYAINQDFVFATKTAQEVKDVIEMFKAGALSLVDFIKEMQRYGRIADGDATEIAARAIRDQSRGLSLFDSNNLTANIVTPEIQQRLDTDLIGDATQEEVRVGI